MNTSVLTSIMEPKVSNFFGQQLIGVYILNTYDVPDTFLDTHNTCDKFFCFFVSKDLVFFNGPRQTTNKKT